MDEHESEKLKVLGKFYGRSVYGDLCTIRDLGYLYSAEDWKFLQFRGEIEVDAFSPHECKIMLQSGIELYLVKKRRTWLDYDWILLYADEKRP